MMSADAIPTLATAATDWAATTIPRLIPRMEPVVDYEYRLIETRLERLRDAERHARLGQGYPTASILWRIMRGDMSKGTVPSGLNGVESAAHALTEIELEIDETKKAIDRLPPHLKLPITLAYLDTRRIKLTDKIPEEISQRKFFDDLRCAKHRLVGMLL
jgi:hypothetical protein